MAKNIQRLTKKSVLAEVNVLRDRINEIARMTDTELINELRGTCSNASTRAEITKSLTISATYYLTNVLNLE